MDKDAHVQKKSRPNEEEGGVAQADPERSVSLPGKRSNTNVLDSKRCRAHSADSNVSTKRNERLSQSDRNQIKSYFNGVCSNLNVEDSRQMAKYYYYEKKEVRYYYQLSKGTEITNHLDIKLDRHNGQEVLVARSVSSPLDGDAGVLINPAQSPCLALGSKIKTLEALFEDSNFQKVIEHVNKFGYWVLPPDLLQGKKFSVLSSCDINEASIPSKEICEASKSFFKQFPIMLEKFCRLKIRELIQFVNTGEHIAVSTEIKLSIMLIEHTQVHVIEANIQFDSSKARAITLVQPNHKAYSSLMEALNQAAWLHENDDRYTHIRFSNMPIEDDISLSYFLSKNINYGLLPNDVEKKAAQGSSHVNFWEAVAYKRKKREDIDWREIDEIQSQLEANKSKIGRISLAEKTTHLANFREGIQQKVYVDKILQNQRLMMGTLLHLPTGFGKTFIILMAMAEHRRMLLAEKHPIKPYLVVVAAKNVAQSWDDNFERLNHIKKSDPLANIFNLEEGENAVYQNFCDDGPSKSRAFQEYCLSNEPKDAIVVSVTTDTLNNSVDGFFKVLVTDGKGSGFSFDIIETLRFASILSQKGYIIGDEDYWRSQFSSLFNDINLKLIPLLEETNINVDWQQQVGSAEDFFYPRSRRGDGLVNQGSLTANRKKFQNSYSDLSIAIPGLNKFCLGGEISEEKMGDLYDWFTLYYRAKHLFKSLNDKEEVDLTTFFACLVKDEKTILQLLQDYKTKQNQAVKQYEQFRNCFSGLVIDESEQVLVVSSQSNKSDRRGKGKDGGQHKGASATSILLDMSRYYQNIASLGCKTNPLVIAASATPWPNEMRQFSLHMQFLMPRLIDQYSVLHHTLFRTWDRFESEIDNLNKSAEKMAFKAREIIERWFQKWVHTLFLAAVAYEAPQCGVTNFSEEEIFFVECDANIQDVVKDGKLTDDGPDKSADDESKKKNFMGIIQRFYSVLIKTTSIISSERGKNSIFDKLHYGEKIAFYVANYNEAALLSMKLTDYFAPEGGVVKTDEVQIGFFYEDAFVKSQRGKKERVSQHYANITYNTDRNFNRNAFNNIVKLDDFYKYLDQYLKANGRPVWKNVFLQAKLFSGFSESSDEEVAKKIEKEIKLFIPSQSNLSAWEKRKDRKSVLGRFVSFLRLAIELERYSEGNLIRDFFKELEKFKGFLPEKFQKVKDLKKGFFDFRIEYMKEFKEGKVSSSGNGPMVDNPFDGFIYQFLHYLVKVCQSNFFIFGDAGTSGMRIDADRLVVLSGAWTEGRLTQVKGRVGRVKGNDHRKCIIYLPITNTLFEYFILRYYVKKAHCNDLITRANVMEFGEIADPLFLSREIFRLYKQLVDSKNYIDPQVHEKVRENIAEDRSYLSLEPYKKAMKIVPNEIRESLQLFNQQLGELPALQAMQVAFAPEKMVDQSLETIDEEEGWISEESESWGEEFSQWIALYAESRGWMRQQNEFNAGSVLRALVPERNIIITQSWWPTDTVLQEELSYSETTTDTHFSGCQDEKNAQSLILSVNLKCDDGVIRIDTGAIEDSLKKKKYSRVADRGGERWLLTCSTKDQAVHWPKEMPDELYVELSVPREAQVSQINVEALKMSDKNYVLYGELAGGSAERITHFWTYRSGNGVCYELDDLKNMIRCRSGEGTPQHSQSRIFRFISSKELSVFKALRPRRLINKNNNCFINAAFQLADSEALRAAILAFKNQQLPNLPSCSVEQLLDLESESSKHQAPPTIFPYKPESYFYSSEMLNKFVKPECQQIILFMPTRGVTSRDYGDGRIDGDIDPIKWVKNFTNMLRSTFQSHQVILILGLNVESVSPVKESQQLDGLLAKLQAISYQSSRLRVISAPFIWQKQDRLSGKKPPLGQMRNYCLDQAKKVYDDLIKLQPDNTKIALMSMDGDTELTESSFRYLTKDESRCYRYTIKTGGYHMAGKAMFADETKNIPCEDIEKMTEEEWPLYWTRFVSYFSNKISARLTADATKLVGFREFSILHFGYCSEPAIYVSPELTKVLFSALPSGRSFMNFDADRKAPFGFWDNEGRRFRRYLNDIIDSENPAAIDMRGPNLLSSEFWPLLRNYERFKIPAPPHRKLKQALTKDELAWVISNMHRQPQHLIKPWFTGSNIAVILKMQAYLLRGFASYFYIKPMLLLLNFGPKRANMFSHYLHKRYLEPNYQVNDEMINLFGCQKVGFLAFVEKNFFEPLGQGDENSEQFRQYATILALWSRIVTELLMTWFQEHFVEEYRCEPGAERASYLPMALPDSYPKQAVEMAREDEAQQDNPPDEAAGEASPLLTSADSVVHQQVSMSDRVEQAIDHVIDYFNEKCDDDVSEYSRSNKHVLKLSEISPAFKRLVVVTNRIVILVDKVGMKPSDLTKALQDLLTYIHEHIKREQKPVSLAIGFNLGGDLNPSFHSLDDEDMLTTSLGEELFSKEKLVGYIKNLEPQDKKGSLGSSGSFFSHSGVKPVASHGSATSLLI